MELFFTLGNVLVAGVAGFLVGAVWFSPVLFMKAWLKGEGVSKDQIPKRSGIYLFQINLYSLIAHGAIASVLAIIFDVLAVGSMSTAVVVGLLITLGFVVTTSFIDMVYSPQGKHYEARSQIKFLVRSGYYLVAITVMGVVLYCVSQA